MGKAFPWKTIYIVLKGYLNEWPKENGYCFDSPTLIGVGTN